MVSVAGLTEHYRRAFDENQARVLVEAAVQIEADLVRREDFSRLTAVVDRLAAAQERTEQELRKLAIGHQELAASQQKLVEGQARLVEGHERLVEGQERLTSALEQLSWTVRDMQKQLGGLGQTVGYALEAYVLERLPRLLARRYGFVESTAMPETFTRPDGMADEIDVVVRGRILGRPVAFLCEAKTNITPREVQDFLAAVDRVRSSVGCDDVRTIFFAYRASGEARQAIAAAGGYLAFPHDIIVAPA